MGSTASPQTFHIIFILVSSLHHHIINFPPFGISCPIQFPGIVVFQGEHWTGFRHVRGTNFIHDCSATYTWVIPSGGSRGAADNLFLLQSRIRSSSCPSEHEQWTGQDSRAHALKLKSKKTRAEGTGQSSAILNVFLQNATALRG